jgi:hypothetical protein
MKNLGYGLLDHYQVLDALICQVEVYAPVGSMLKIAGGFAPHVS